MEWSCFWSIICSIILLLVKIVHLATLHGNIKSQLGYTRVNQELTISQNLITYKHLKVVEENMTN